jgi:hypothetical protein
MSCVTWKNPCVKLQCLGTSNRHYIVLLQCFVDINRPAPMLDFHIYISKRWVQEGTVIDFGKLVWQVCFVIPGPGFRHFQSVTESFDSIMKLDGNVTDSFHLWILAGNFYQDSGVSNLNDRIFDSINETWRKRYWKFPSLDTCRKLLSGFRGFQSVTES